MATRDTVLARILIDDQTKLGFNSYARNVERAKKTSEAFRKHAIDKISVGLENQVQALKKSAKELDLLAAANMGANQAQLDHITSLHQAIDAHKREAEAQEEAARQAKAKADEDKRASDITEKTIRQLNFEAKAANMTADQIQLMKLEMMGLSKAQIDQVKAAQLATSEMREQGVVAANTSKTGLRIMRGGFGQLGHQVQDIAVQLQMGQNAMLVFGQQGSQIASLFGQNGALIGALLAVGAAVGTSLAPALFKTRDHLEELEEVAQRVAKVMALDFVTGTGTLTDEIIELGQVSEDLARRKLKGGLEAAILSVTVAQEGLLEKVDEFDTRTHAGFVVPQSIGELKTQFGITKDSAEQLIHAAVAVGQGVDGAVPAFDSLLQSINHSRNATTEQKQALLDARTAIDELTEAEILNERQIAALTALQSNFSEELKSGTKEAQELAQSQKEIQQTVDGLVSSLQNEIIALEVGEDAAQRLKLANEGLSASDIDMVMALRNRIKEQQKANAETEEAVQAEIDAANSRQNFVAGVVAQADALGKSNIELLEANILTGQLDATQQTAFTNAIERMREFKAEQDKQAGIANIEALRQSLATQEEALEQAFVNENQIIADGLAARSVTEEAARELQLKLLADYNKKKKDLVKDGADQEILTGSKLTGHMLGQLGEQFAGVQAQNKKMFAAQKAFKIANAIQNTYDAANNALSSPYLPPLPQILAATAVAAGLANVAKIRSTSFEGGGFTGRGARSGGMDGKGGFPAILHPNETVIDHTKGQGGGVTIVNNIDATGADANVDMKIRSAVEQGSQQTVATIQDLLRRRRFV
jgi:hypothetical protein